MKEIIQQQNLTKATKISKAAFMTLAVCFILLLMPFTAKAATSSDGNWYYTVLSNNTISAKPADPTILSGNVIIPQTIDGHTVTGIDNNAFDGCSGITNIQIPTTVTTLGDYAFYGCSGLTSINLPANLSTIGSYAFSSCTNLKTITLPNCVTSIDTYAFSNCSNLISISLPSSTKNISNYCFYECNSLASVIIPNGVTSISEYAFASCQNLTTITIANSVKSIKSYAFWDCSHLTTVKGYKNSYAQKFATANNYKFVILNPGSSDSATTIPAKGFTVVAGNLKYKVIKSAATNGTVTVIGATNKNLKSVTIPASIKISGYTFKVTSISSNAFKNYIKLKTILIKSKTIKSVGKNAIKGINKKATIKVPKSKYSAYKKLFKSNTGFKKSTMKIKK